MNMEKCMKEAFAVIGKEGSTEDGPGFVQNLWTDANAHFAEVAQLAKVVGADIHEIQPKVPYTKADLNWMDKKSRSSIEMNNKTIRSEIADASIQIDGYDVVFLGFPIWWHVAPTIINTFLESADFSGKKIILFATSGGSKFGKTVEELKVRVSADTEMIEGKLLNVRQSVESIKAWTDTLELSREGVGLYDQTGIGCLSDRYLQRHQRESFCQVSQLSGVPAQWEQEVVCRHYGYPQKESGTVRRGGNQRCESQV